METNQKHTPRKTFFYSYSSENEKQDLYRKVSQVKGRLCSGKKTGEITTYCMLNRVMDYYIAMRLKVTEEKGFISTDIRLQTRTVIVESSMMYV